MLVDWGQFVMVVGGDDAIPSSCSILVSGGGGGGSVQKNWHVSIKRTAIHGFRALFLIRLGTRVTTGRVAAHCARGSRSACCNSASGGAAGWLTLHPVACTWDVE